jgi:methyl-accepting chemotaxis protein
MPTRPMRLSLKLPLSFAAVLVLLVGAAMLGFWQLDKALGTFSREVAQAVQNERDARSLEIGFKEQVQEWKNVLLRGKDPAQLSKYWAAFQKQELKVAASAADLQARLRDGPTKASLAQFVDAHARMGQAYRRGFEAFKQADFAHEKGDAAVRGMDREPVKLLDEVGDAIAKDSAAVSAAAFDAGRRAELFSLIGMALMTVLGIAVGLGMSRSVTRLLGGEPNDAAAAALAIAKGDLSTVLAVHAGSKASVMVALVQMQTSLVNLVAAVRNKADGVACATAQIAQGNADLSDRTERQASALQQTAASVEQLTRAVRRNADIALQANALAVTANDTAAMGGEVVQQVVDTIHGISESAKKIADINGVIDGLAFQTNILALNAAVEAARAGDQGRGFAVVAAEVRTLAQRSAAAAREIKQLIAASVERMEQGTALADRAGTTMTQVMSASQRVADITGEISVASREQDSSVTQINLAVSQIDQATQQNSALVEESAAAAENLREQAQQLVQSVSAFKTSTAC